MENRGTKAARLFREEGYNCAQATFLAFNDLMGMDEKIAIHLSSSFGGGMGRMREVCGAVSGALMALGALMGPDDPTDQAAKMEHYRRIQEFARRFKALHGTIICRELLGEKMAGTGHVPAERTEEYYAMRPCERMCYDAAQLMDELMQELKSEA